ncbi:hypothetical protein ACH6EH_16860 [Paenibacillus sp. JSM ZJ436]
MRSHEWCVPGKAGRLDKGSESNPCPAVTYDGLAVMLLERARTAWIKTARQEFGDHQASCSPFEESSYIEVK